MKLGWWVEDGVCWMVGWDGMVVGCGILDGDAGVG